MAQCVVVAYWWPVPILTQSDMNADTAILTAGQLLRHFPPLTATPRNASALLDVATMVLHYDEAWTAHPSHVAQESPEVVTIWQHEPGRDHKRLSFVVGPLLDLTSPHEYAWGSKRLGSFAGILPILPEIPVSLSRILVANNSLRGAGQGFYARERLKELAPKLRKIINATRRIHRRPKSYFFSSEEIQAMRMGLTVLDSRSTMTKQQLWEASLSHTDRALIDRYIEPTMFWQIVGGKVHPDAVDMCVYGVQLSLDLSEAA